jgi:hypothetical protein
VIPVLLTLALSAQSTAYCQTDSEYYRGIFATPLTYDDSPLGLSIGSVELQVPKNTLFAVPASTPKQIAILLRVLYPEMKGRTLANRNEFRKIDQTSRQLTVLIKDLSLQSMPLTNQQYLQSVYNTAMNLFRRVDTPAISSHDEELLGLTHTHVRWSNSYQYDVLVPPSDDPQKRTTVIKCTLGGRGPGLYPNPQCSSYFLFRELSVKTSFARSKLQDWRAIQSTVVEWLNGKAR